VSTNAITGPSVNVCRRSKTVRVRVESGESALVARWSSQETGLRTVTEALHAVGVAEEDDAAQLGAAGVEIER
jgi:hypothetical protein